MTKEVKARLTLEDAASATMKKISGGFSELVGSEKSANDGMSAIKQSLATMAGVYLPQLTSRVLDFGKSFVTAAASGYADDAAIAGLASAVQDIPYEQAIGRAQAYGDQLDVISIKSGVMSRAVGDGFQRMVEIQGASTEGLERARDQTAQLANIAGKLNIPFETASAEVGFMGEGMLRARGRMAQLLQATGVFGPSLKKAAAGWSQLTEEKRMEVLSKGLELASSRVDKMPRTFNQLVGSLENIAQISKEHLGEPLVDALAPELEKLVDYLDKNRYAVERFAKSMAKDVGHWAETAAKEVQEAFGWLVDHQQEIKDDIVAAFDHAKTVVQFILDHKEAIALAFGAKALGPGAMALAKPGMSALGGIYNAGAAGIGADGLGVAKLSGALGGVAALGAFALAVGAATIAVDQWTDLMNVTGGGKSEDRLNFEAIQQRLQAMLDNPDRGVWDQSQLDYFSHMRANLVHLADELGENQRAAGDLADAAFAAHRAVRQISEPFEAAARALDAMSQNGVDAEGQDKAVATIADGFMAAIKAGDAGTEQYIADLLAHSSALQLAFLQSSTMTGDGFNALADLVGGQAKDFADKLHQKADFAGDKTKPDVPKIQMNGGQSFKIQQDFRDEDPDRIAFVFQRDIAGAAERRLSAVTSTPFGG